MKQAASYIRVSSTKQLDGDGPERQKDSNRRFGYSTNHRIGRTFVEDVSGTKDSTDRPVWAEMLTWCAENDVHTVIVEKVDRLARDLIVGELLLAQCRQLGITVLDAASGQDLTDESDDPTVVLIRQMMLAVAQYEKSALVKKMRVARDRVRAAGKKCEGRKGYAELKPVVLTLAQSMSALGPTAIAEKLNFYGYTTLSGKPFTRQTVHSMLSGS